MTTIELCINVLLRKNFVGLNKIHVLVLILHEVIKPDNQFGKRNFSVTQWISYHIIKEFVVCLNIISTLKKTQGCYIFQGTLCDKVL